MSLLELTSATAKDAPVAVVGNGDSSVLTQAEQLMSQEHLLNWYGEDLLRR
jgi:hypothetical protein